MIKCPAQGLACHKQPVNGSQYSKCPESGFRPGLKTLMSSTTPWSPSPCLPRFTLSHSIPLRSSLSELTSRPNTQRCYQGGGHNELSAPGHLLLLIHVGRSGSKKKHWAHGDWWVPRGFHFLPTLSTSWGRTAASSLHFKTVLSKSKV